MKIGYLRIFFVFIILPLIAASFSCGSNDNIESDTHVTEEIRGEETEADADEDKFPREIQDFGGYKFRVIAAEDMGGNGLYYGDLEIEEEIGEIYNDAVYKRNMELKTKFNIEFSSINVGDLTTAVSTSSAAGMDEYDLILPRLNTAWTLIPYCNDLMQFENLSLGESWYDQNCISDLSVANKLYMITGDAFTKHYDGIIHLLFNKDMAEDYEIPDLYTMVKEGKWTLDAMSEIVKGITHDFDGNSIMDRYDLWGYAQQGAVIDGVINGTGLRFMYKDDNDIPYIAPNTERMTETIDKFLSFFIDHTWDSTRDGKNQHLSAFWVFPEGRALFNGIILRYIGWQLRGIENDFGILPMPKLDDTQENYYASTNAYHTYCYMMPKTVSNPEQTSYIFDAMGYYGEKIIKPAYYEMNLTRKYTRDEESNEMLDIIFSSTVYDLGVYANFGSLTTTIREMVLNGRNMYASIYETMQGKVETAIDNFLTSINE